MEKYIFVIFHHEDKLAIILKNFFEMGLNDSKKTAWQNTTLATFLAECCRVSIYCKVDDGEHMY